MKKQVFILSLLYCSHVFTFNFSSFKTNHFRSSHRLEKDSFENPDQLLVQFKNLIQEQWAKTVNGLEQSENKDDQRLAELLKERTELDHIRIIMGNTLIYLQLSNSKLPGGILGRSLCGKDYEYDKETIKQQMIEFFKKLPTYYKAKISVYLSNKQRKEKKTFIQKLLGPTLVNDLYSASITIKDRTET